MKVKVYSKLNLSLNVFPREGEFHPIDSVAVSVGICDIVSVKKSKSQTVTLRGCKGIPVEKNSAYRAAVAFAEKFGTTGCRIAISKHIPVGMGLGGSSADAAAVVACLCKLYDVDKNSDDVAALCSGLGSDVNFMLHGGCGRMRGKGDDVVFLQDYPRLFFAVTFFDPSLSAAEVYRRFDEIGGSEHCDNDVLTEQLAAYNVGEAKAMFSNGLQAAAESLLPKPVVEQVEGYRRFCISHNFNCCMSGSGSAYFCTFETLDEAKFAAKLLNAAHFRTRAVAYNAWGVETTNIIFKIV